MGGRKDIYGGKIGTSFEAKKWLSLDVCGCVGVTLSFSIHLFSCIVIVSHLIEDSLIANAIFLLLYLPTFSLALASLFMAWTTDPGCVPMGARPLVTVRLASSATGNGSTGAVSNVRTRALRRCPKCDDNFKPGRAHHDSVTGRCVVKFDHFCPWVGNAVGAMNHKFFVLFIGYTMVTCLVSLFLIGLRAISCGGPSPFFSQETNGIESWCTRWNESYYGLALLVISVIFFLFTSCMLSEQVEAIKTNTSKIARMKMSVGNAGTELSRVTEEFNEMFGGDSNRVAIHWFLPLPVEYPNGMKKVVLGYDWDETFEAVPYKEPDSGDLEAEMSNSVAGSRIELTSVPQTTSSNASQKITEYNTLAKPGRPVLVRRNSKQCDQDDSLRPSDGTLT
mmetsp:Transcript_23323/g.55156  ORF Transcript_23323/g.55156 Transcript_23323/m.55156 type:complete len:392 (+) Transcript_23323:239-1414(+)